MFMFVLFSAIAHIAPTKLTKKARWIAPMSTWPSSPQARSPTPPPACLHHQVALHLPRFLRGAIDPAALETRSVQFAVGGAGSGAPMHYHKAAVNTLVYGKKRWWLAPPRDAIYSSIPAAAWAEGGGPARAAAAGRTLLRCVQRPGDVLFLPDFWGHAVLNEEASVGVASEFETARMNFAFRG